MRALTFDLRHALRALVRRPGFAAVVTLTMAIGIGANVAFFAYLSYLIWPTMQAPEPERLVWIHDRRPEQVAGPTSYLDWLDIRDAAGSFARMAIWRFYSTSVTVEDRVFHSWGQAVGGDYFAVFGARPVVGRLLRPEDDRPGAEPVVVLHHFFWQKYLGADPDVVGRTIQLDVRHAYTVVGVTRRGFQGQGVTTGVYVPMATAEWLPFRDQRDRRNSLALARLRPDMTRTAASHELASIGAGLDRAHPEDEARDLSAVPIGDLGPTDESSFVLASKALMVAVGLLLLLACANVANLMLARATARGREMAVHRALGAQRWRLGRRLLIESLVLSSAGGALGLLLAERIQAIIVGYLVQTVPIGFGDWATEMTIIGNGGAIAAFFTAACVGAGLLFGALPAVAAARTDLVSALKGDGAPSKGRWRAKEALVVVQVALSVLLLLGAGLMVRSASRARGVALGFDPHGLEIAALYFATADRAGEQVDGKTRYEQILRETRDLPGATTATLVNIVPLSANSRQLMVQGESGEAEPLDFTAVASDYFRTLGVPLIAGRVLDDRDADGAPPVGVVNQRAAAALWPGASPIGQVLRVDGDAGPGSEAIEIVGVVADSRYQLPTEDIEPQVYLPYRQRFHRRMTLLVRTRSPIERPLRALLARGFPEVSVIEVVPFTEQVRRAVAQQRMNADLAGGFGLLGLMLAALGIFSVTSYAVARRRREIGVRMALGADRGRIVRLVLGEVARLAALGIVIGLALALALGRLIRSLLYGVGTYDPPTLIAVPLALAAVVLLAAAVPTRRAARIDPLRAIRTE